MITRWTPYRKAVVVLAVAEGILTAEQLDELHGVTAPELAQWKRLYELHGTRALRITRLNNYRKANGGDGTPAPIVIDDQ